MMKPYITAALAAAALLASCSGNNGAATDAAADNDTVAAPAVDLTGRWIIESVVASDSMSVRPAEITPEAEQTMTFADGSYSIQTNCNSFNGAYTQAGDSLTLGDGFLTEMACDNMEVEDMLRTMIPAVATVDAVNDSIVRLNTANPASYIVIRRATKE